MRKRTRIQPIGNAVANECANRMQRNTLMEHLLLAFGRLLAFNRMSEPEMSGRAEPPT
jgi:hypothetical protein